jgi:hypothetical protein
MPFPVDRFILSARATATLALLTTAFGTQSLSAQVKIESVARQTLARLHDVPEDSGVYFPRLRSHALSDNSSLGQLLLPEREVARFFPSNTTIFSTVIIDYDSTITPQRLFLDGSAEANMDPVVLTNPGAKQRGAWCDSSGYYEVIFSSPSALFFNVTATVSTEDKALSGPAYVSFTSLDDYFFLATRQHEGTYSRGPQSSVKLISLDATSDPIIDLVDNASKQTSGALPAGRWKLRAEFEAYGLEREYSRTKTKLDLQLEVLESPKISSISKSVIAVSGQPVALSVEASGRVLTFQWSKEGKAIPGATQATFSIARFSEEDVGSYSVEVSNAAGKVISTAVSVSRQLPPAIAAQPFNVTANLGGTATFRVISSASETLSYQWRLNGAPIAGATNSTYTIFTITAASAGSYSVVVSNIAGSTTSSAGILTVVGGPGAPAISGQPASQLIANGSTVVFSVTPETGQASLNAALADRAARAIAASSFQWQLNGVAIVGATSAQLVVSRATSANAGIYTCVITMAGLSTVSNPATLTVASVANFGRLINLSILTDISVAAPSFTVGTVIGGAGASGIKPLLVRAVGPSLTPFGVGGALGDPKLDIFSGQTVIASNDNWGGATALGDAFTQIGAFAYASTSSKDAAIFNPATAPGGYTIQVSGNGGTTGTVIAELYDGTPSSAFGANSPRLINVSVLKQIDPSTTLTAGFVVGGTTSKTVLIRAIGPRLALEPFNVGGVMADPKLELFSGPTVIASNDNWGGDPQLTTVCASIGAFAVNDGTSKDAMLLVTLAPGSYTAQVGGMAATGGLALIEVYEVP